MNQISDSNLLKTFSDDDNKKRLRPIWPYHGLDQSKSRVQRILGDSSISFRGSQLPSQGHFSQSLTDNSFNDISIWRKSNFLCGSSPTVTSFMIFFVIIRIWFSNLSMKFSSEGNPISSPSVWGAFPSRKSSWKFPHSLERPVRLSSKPNWNF